jgi:pimeloyl-ACP methyl ester carboxylesterase
MDFRVDDYRLSVDVSGTGDPLLFIHGFPLSREMWRHAAEVFSDRWTCINPDLRGHGESKVTPDVTIDRFADDMAALIEHFGQGRRAVVIGLSMGGIIGLDLFRRHRDLVRALGLIDTRANAESSEGVQRRENVALTALNEGTRAVVDAMLPNVFSLKFDAELRDNWYRLMCASPPAGVAAASRALAGRRDSFPLLPEIDVPTLVVVGEDDAITPVQTLREIHELIRGSRFAIIPGAGHVPPVETPDEFVRILRSFLDSLTPLR